METHKLLDIYSDYLLCSFGQTTATGLSSVLGNSISHDTITRLLSGNSFSSRDLWLLVKKTVRSIESDDGVLIFDDTIQEKEYTDENSVICWHYDHCSKKSVKGVNLLNCLYYNAEISIPINFEIIHKDELYWDEKIKTEKRRSKLTKNELLLEMLKKSISNQVKFRYVLCDSWYSSKHTLQFIKQKAKKEFVMAIKQNRKVALSKNDKLKGNFNKINTIELDDEYCKSVYIQGLDFPVMLCKQVFKNKDGSTGVLYLVCSNCSLDYDQITTIYKKRWKVEEFHKSIKSNTAFAKSPTKTVRTQKNHFFASIYAFYKLELIKLKEKTNHFAIKSKLYITAVRMAMLQLNSLTA